MPSRSAESTLVPKLGEVLVGKYRILRLIGEGGMGAVYEAEHLRLGKSVALKIPRDDLLRDPEFLARFEREPRLAAATGHRGVVEVYDVGVTEEGAPFVVMELLVGRSLSALLREEGRLEQRKVIYVCAQVLSALDAAHGQGIVHRDLKPDNIFLVDVGRPLPEVKLLDFGSAKSHSGNLPDEHRLTQAGTILGTPAYLAPEQISDDEEPDHRADLHAMGVVLYELLTGTLPYEAPTVYGLLHRVINDEPQPPRERCPEIPRELEAVILRALAKDRDERFSSAQSMLRAILPFLDERDRARVWLPEALLRDLPSESPEERPAPPPPPSVAPSDPLPDDSGESATPAAAPPEPSEGLSGGVEEPAAARRSRLNVAFWGALVVGLLLAAALVGAFLSGRDGPGPTQAAVPRSDETQSDALPPRASAAEPDGGAASAVDAGPILVTVTLRGVPEGSEVFLDHARVTKHRITLPRSEVARLLVIERQGRELFRSLVDFGDDQTIDVTPLLPPGKARPSNPGARDETARGVPPAQLSPEPDRDAAPREPRLGFTKEWPRHQ